MNIKIIPLINQDGSANTIAVLQNWKYFIYGLNKVVIHSKNDVSIDGVFNQLLNGFLIMHTIYVDDIYRGFFTARIDIINKFESKCPIYFFIISS